MSEIKEVLHSQVGYSAWATSQLLAVCTKLTAEQLDAAVGASHAGILGTLSHVYDGERVWLRRLLAPSEEQSLPPGPAPLVTLGFLIHAWPSLWQTYQDWIEGAEEADLTAALATVLPDGKLVRAERWKIVLHTVNHATMHRGQMVTMLRGLGVKPPDTDLTAYWAS
jgi:uncharacterized damage-inducible protein DinB